MDDEPPAPATRHTLIVKLRDPADDPSATALFEAEYRRRLFRWAADEVKDEFTPKTWDAFWQTAHEVGSIAFIEVRNIDWLVLMSRGGCSNAAKSCADLRDVETVLVGIPERVLGPAYPTKERVNLSRARLIELRGLPGLTTMSPWIRVEAIRGNRAMQTVHVQSQSSSDGVLHLDIPVESPNADYDVVVVLQPRPAVATVTPEARGWPPGFFEATAGAWQGDFVRDQGQFEERVEFRDQ
ncbi:MAG: hypothetical protein ACLQGP_29405 [Isosphaeraceae bacterium]